MDAAHQLTAEAWSTRADLRQTIKRKEFDKLSFKAVGDSLRNGATDLQSVPVESGTAEVPDAFYEKLAIDYYDNLDRLAALARPDVDRHIPCHLFHANQEVKAFSIGLVAFRPRSEWLDAFVTDPVARDHVRQVEGGKLHIDELRRRANAAGSAPELRNALDVVSSLRNFAWVATIRIVQHELSQSHDKLPAIVCALACADWAAPPR